MKKLILQSTTVKILDNDAQLEAVAGGGRPRRPPQEPRLSRQGPCVPSIGRCGTASPE